MSYFLLTLSKASWLLQIILLLAVSLPSFAQSITQLNLSSALQRSEANNAELLLYPYQQQQAAALAEQAQIRPTPELSLAMENIIGNGAYKALDSAEITLSLSQNIELGGKQDKRTAFAHASGQFEQAEFALSRLDVLAETSRRYYQALKIQALQEVVSQRIKQEKKALKTISKRARSGAVNQASVAKIDLRLAQSRALLETLKQEKVLSYRRLAAMWQQGVNFDSIAGNLKSPPDIPTEVAVLAAWNKSPTFMQQQAAVRLADAQVNLAQSQGRSNMNVGVGIRHFEATDNQALNVSISIPLAFNNPNRGRIKAAQALQRKSHVQLQQQQQILSLQLLELQMQMQWLQQQINNIDTSLLPKAKRLVKDTETGFNRGKFSVLQWVDAQAELYALQQAQIEKTHLMYLQLLELERVTGQALTSSSTTSSAVILEKKNANI